MTPIAAPIVKDLVLIGGGHSHVAVLKRFGMRPLPGVRLTVICRDVHTPYSGMLPGFVAGHYDFDDIHIDLAPLARFAKARLYHDDAIGLDFENRRVLCRNRPPVAYDLLSINIGSTPRIDDVPGAEERVVPVKPINRFVARWNDLEARVIAADGKSRIAVVGAGAGGVELILAARHRLRAALKASGSGIDGLDFHLVSDSRTILPSHNAGVRAKFERLLAGRDITVHNSQRVVSVDEHALTTADGTRLECDEILWVTMAGGAPWLGDTGLALDDNGFVRVGADLQSVSHPGVFAAGDIAAVDPFPREKAGVFAVRQGPPLTRNLRRALQGRTPRPFTPQRHYLALIGTGEKYAIASRPGISFAGAWVWRWKEWIDRRFMRKFNELPEMDEATEGPRVAAGLADAAALKEISALAMRCGGCGAKVGATVLTRALASIEPAARPEVLVGLHDPDDAAIIEPPPPGKLLVQTVDFFRAFIDDPYVFGQIAANHALSDIYAMGAEPTTALAIAAVPPGVEAKVEEQLYQMMAGAARVLADADTALVGGHTCEGAELALGFAVNGTAERERLLHKKGLVAGDRLILTKPLGTGTLLAADMRGKAKGRWLTGALAAMLQPNREAAQILFAHGARACTDVTGFGLLGHLVEMIKPSTVDVTLDLDALPLLDGARETVAMGILSSLQPENVRLRRAIRDLERWSAHPVYPLLFDPQTSGGMLGGVPEEHADACLEALRTAGCDAAVIGTVTDPDGALEPVSLRG
jgi:selenide, water dikinase